MSIEAISVEALKFKQGVPLAKHIVVPYKIKDEVMCNNIWLRCVHITGRKFFQGSRRSTRFRHY